MSYGITGRMTPQCVLLYAVLQACWATPNLKMSTSKGQAPQCLDRYRAEMKLQWARKFLEATGHLDVRERLIIGMRFGPMAAAQSMIPSILYIMPGKLEASEGL